MVRSLVFVTTVALAALCVARASAYKLFGPYEWGTEATYYQKLGDIITVGQSPGTITWSIMPDGTTIDPLFFNPDFHGTSSLGSIMTTLGYAQAEATIQRVLDKWSAAANIYFERVSDSGAPYHSAAALTSETGRIRFGAFPISNFGGGGVTYAPYPYAGSSEADVILNASNTFFFDPGGEGAPIQIFNDFESLLMHEVGHALGLDHSETQSVMSADYQIFQYVNRQLDADDLAAIQFLYGPAIKSDFNRNTVADGGDLPIWKANFGLGSGAIKGLGDATGDAAVRGDDFLVWQREYASPASAAAAVPEPAAQVLILLASAFLLHASRRR